MNIYRISCYSACGTYFQPYLQSVTVIADSREDSIKIVQKWLNDNGYRFLEKDSAKWEVTELSQCLQAGVVDWTEDSDY